MNIITVEPFNFIGIAITTSNEDYNKLSQDMQGLWNRFMSENIIDKLPGMLGNELYCIYTDYEGDHTKPYSAILGCKVENLESIPDGLVGKSFAGGKYIKEVAKGNIFEGVVYNTWKNIWDMDISRAYTADFEVYGAKAQNPQNAEIEILVAIK
ncbi:MAG: AraC family transcriptional regulator [Burkholderiales bacterium]|jgi:predicted transcriptional regulator YdeE|nr:AraC family transcriptional regulator [Burkholderiales bacterium]